MARGAEDEAGNWGSSPSRGSSSYGCGRLHVARVFTFFWEEDCREEPTQTRHPEKESKNGRQPNVLEVGRYPVASADGLQVGAGDCDECRILVRRESDLVVDIGADRECRGAGVVGRTVG